MKTSITAFACAISLISGSNASAQTARGKIILHGFVTPRCGTAVDPGSSFAGSISLDDEGNAEIRPQQAQANLPRAPSSAAASFQLGCSGTAASIAVNGTRLSPRPLAARDGARAMPQQPGDMHVRLAASADRPDFLVLTLSPTP